MKKNHDLEYRQPEANQWKIPVLTAHIRKKLNRSFQTFDCKPKYL